MKIIDKFKIHAIRLFGNRRGQLIGTIEESHEETEKTHTVDEHGKITLGEDEEKKPHKVKIEPEEPIEDLAGRTVADAMNKIPAEDQIAALQFEMKKLNDMQKKNIGRANKLVKATMAKLMEMGFSFTVREVPPAVAIRPINLEEWGMVKKERFRQSFLPRQ